MQIRLLIVGLMLAAVLLVGVGNRLRLPWPALMLVLGVAVAFVSRRWPGRCGCRAGC